jgi:hypothetical protein
MFRCYDISRYSQNVFLPTGIPLGDDEERKNLKHNTIRQYLINNKWKKMSFITKKSTKISRLILEYSQRSLTSYLPQGSPWEG